MDPITLIVAALATGAASAAMQSGTSEAVKDAYCTVEGPCSQAIRRPSSRRADIGAARSRAGNVAGAARG